MVESSHVLEQKLNATSGYIPLWAQRAVSALGYYLQMITHRDGNGKSNNPTYNIAAGAADSVAVSVNSANGQNAQHTEERINPKLQAILQDPRWERRLVGAERERFVIGVLEKLGYSNLSGTYNPKGYIFTGHGKIIARVNFREGNYKTFNGSLPDDIGIILEKAEIKPDK